MVKVMNEAALVHRPSVMKNLFKRIKHKAGMGDLAHPSAHN